MTWVARDEHSDPHRLTREFQWKEGYPHFLLEAEVHFRTRPDSAVPQLGDFLAIKVWFKTDNRSGWMDTYSWPASLLGHMLALVEVAKVKWGLKSLAQEEGPFGIGALWTGGTIIADEVDGAVLDLERLVDRYLGAGLGSYWSDSGMGIVRPGDSQWQSIHYRAACVTPGDFSTLCATETAFRGDPGAARFEWHQITDVIVRTVLRRFR